MTCGTDITAQRDADQRIVYSLRGNFTFENVTPRLKVWPESGSVNSASLTVTTIATPGGSVWVNSGNNLVLTLGKDDLAALPEGDLLYDITLTDAQGFENPFTGGFFNLYDDGSQSCGSCTSDFQFNASGQCVSVSLVGGNLAASTSLSEAALNDAVFAAEGFAQDAAFSSSSSSASASASASSSAAAAQSAIDADADRIAAQAAVVAASAQVSNVAAATAGELYASNADALSNGVQGIASLVAGTGGTNGTFAIAFSGGGGTGAAGVFTVAGGAVVSTTLTAAGRGYTSAPAISFAASTGLTGASATSVIAQNQPPGTYWVIPSADGYAPHTNVGGVATSLVPFLNATAQQRQFLKMEQAILAPRLVMAGDSIIQYNHQGNTPGVVLRTNAKGEVAAALAKRPYLEMTCWPDATQNANALLCFAGGNQGVAAENSLQLLNRISETFLQAPDVVIVSIGINDMLSGGVGPNPSGDQTKFNIRTICATLLKRGVRVILATIRPVETAWLALSGSGLTARLAIDSVNADIRSYAASEPNVFLWDTWAAYDDGTSTPGGLPKAGYTEDGLHPDARGAWAESSDELAEIIYGLFKPTRAYPLFSVLNNIYPNSNFLLSGGTASTGVTGTVAGSWRVSRSGLNTIVASLVTNPDTGGNTQRLVITPGGSSPTELTTFQLIGDVVSAVPYQNKWVKGYVRVGLSDWAGWRNIQAVILRDGSLPLTSGNNLRNAATDIMPSSGLNDLIIPIGPVLVPSGTTIFIPTVETRTIHNASGTGTVDIKEMFLTEVPDPRRFYGQ